MFSLTHISWLLLLLWPQISICGTLPKQELLKSDPPNGVASNSSVLDVFQLYKPLPPLLHDEDSCSAVLMQHVFAFSYGMPFVGDYKPPSCSFNTVTINLTVTSQGRQFDRLALMYLGDIEVFRTSTAEPTVNGIIWKYTKDMTQYLSLWKLKQKLIFDLGNLVDSTYTGSFNATLTATFSFVSKPPQTADTILPISARRSLDDAASAFNVPIDNATTSLVVPGGAQRAVVSISACGQADEEFWYSNVPSDVTDTFLNTTGELFGGSPFREVQLFIDGTLAGVVWPFPTIFTGGIAPGFWRPVVGIDAFDLREPEIDISPWLLYLSNGKPHTFQIKVVGLSGPDQTEIAGDVGNYWAVTGKIFLFKSQSAALRYTAGSPPPVVNAPKPDVRVDSRIEKSHGVNQSLMYTVSVSRRLWLQFGLDYWYQALDYSNEGLLMSQGLSQLNRQYTEGTNIALIRPNGWRGGGEIRSSVTFSYPLLVNTTIGALPNNSGFFIDANLQRGLSFFCEGRSDISTYTLVAGPARLDTVQEGSAFYATNGTAGVSYGDIAQDFLQGDNHRQYMRFVEACNGTVVQDSQSPKTVSKELPQPKEVLTYGRDGPRSLVGRGLSRLV